MIFYEQLFWVTKLNQQITKQLYLLQLMNKQNSQASKISQQKSSKVNNGIERENSNKAFLNKFKDKHSIVSKQGLLKLLQHKNQPSGGKLVLSPGKNKYNPSLEPKRNADSLVIKKDIQKNSLSSRPNSFSSDHIVSGKIKQKLMEKQKIIDIQKSLVGRKNSNVSGSHSVQLPAMPKKLPSLQKGSHTQPLKRKSRQNSQQEKKVHTADSHIQKESNNLKSHRKQLSPEKNSHMQQKKKKNSLFDLQKFALDHLEFLERFQERIKNKPAVLM